MARAAAASGVPYILSTMATSSIQEVAAAVAAPRGGAAPNANLWFQARAGAGWLPACAASAPFPLWLPGSCRGWTTELFLPRDVAGRVDHALSLSLDPACDRRPPRRPPPPTHPPKRTRRFT
jgi:hypothetical protein